jgi:hypothetical protein
VTPERCRHLLISSADGMTWRCTGCGAEMVVATTTRTAWADMGHRLQRIRSRGRSVSAPAQQSFKIPE